MAGGANAVVAEEDRGAAVGAVRAAAEVECGVADGGPAGVRRT